jgi:hypothetical protein
MTWEQVKAAIETSLGVAGSHTQMIQVWALNKRICPTQLIEWSFAGSDAAKLMLQAASRWHIHCDVACG